MSTKWFIRSSTVLSLVQIWVPVLVPYRALLYFDTFFSNKNNTFIVTFMIMVRYSTVRTHYRYDWFQKNWHPRIIKGWIIYTNTYTNTTYTKTNFTTTTTFVIILIILIIIIIIIVIVFIIIVIITIITRYYYYYYYYWYK